MRTKRLLGVPFLYASASAAVGFSIYFSIGVVADRGLGLTPLIFLVAGLMFALTSLSYVEGSSMLQERGGSATFARRAFNELKSGLQAPLSGMGTAFSASLFGLASSLVLGFLDLTAGQAQNRFYNELEEWLAGITRLSSGVRTSWDW